MRALIFAVGAERVAVPLVATREVVNDLEVVPLPTAPPTVIGVFNLRGRILPLLDLSSLLGLSPAPHPPVGIVLDTVNGPVTVGTDSLPETGEVTDALERHPHPGVVGRYASDRGAVLLLDVDAAVAPQRIAGWRE